MTSLARQTLSAVSRSGAFSVLVRMLEQLADEKPDLLRVLAYHRIDEPEHRPQLHPGLISATPAEFDRQMAYVARHLSVVTLDEVLQTLQHGAPLPPRAVLITFDDAYCDFAEQAWPILRRYRLPATLFVPTAYPDHPERAFWWDRLYQATRDAERSGRWPASAVATRRNAGRRRGPAAPSFARLRAYIKSLPSDEALDAVDRICRECGVGPLDNPVLTWHELRQLAADGVTLGAHTQTHPLLNRVPLDRARAETVGSWRDLQREIGPTPRVLAYPAGGFDQAVTEMLRAEGFTLAFTMQRGLNDTTQCDPLRVRRIYVGRRTTLPLLRAQLLPWLRHFQSAGC